MTVRAFELLAGEKKLKIVKEDSLLGGHVWPAATALCQYLAKTANDSRLRGATVECLELGSGTGAVGIYAAAVFGYNVTVTEYRPPSGSADRLELLQQNVDANCDLFSSTKELPRVLELDFGDVAMRKHVLDASRTGQGYDLILASDVTYTPGLHEPVAQSISELLAQNTTTNGNGDSSHDSTGLPTCLLSHQERLLNVRGEDYQLYQFEQALSNANLCVVKRSFYDIQDEEEACCEKTHRICVLEIQRGPPTKSGDLSMMP